MAAAEAAERAAGEMKQGRGSHPGLFIRGDLPRLKIGVLGQPAPKPGQTAQVLAARNIWAGCPDIRADLI